VESDTITACICTQDFCNGLEDGEVGSLATVEDEVFSAAQPRSFPAPAPLQQQGGGGGVLCHQCGSLFSGAGGGAECSGFLPSAARQQGYCQPGQVCLWYSWQQSGGRSAVVRECISPAVVLGPPQSPLRPRAACQPEQISTSVSACLCDSDLCNSLAGEGQEGREPGRGETAPALVSPAPRPGLQCYSCGSLLNPNKKCDEFRRIEEQVETCREDEACLLYSWRKSATETATLRECFPTRVLLGSIRDPLTPATSCQQRDITDDRSGSIFACLCSSDLCNEIEPVLGSKTRSGQPRPANPRPAARPGPAARQQDPGDDHDPADHAVPGPGGAAPQQRQSGQLPGRVPARGDRLLPRLHRARRLDRGAQGVRGARCSATQSGAAG